MTTWIAGHELAEHEGRCYEVEGEHVLVCRNQGLFYRMDGSCPYVENGHPCQPLEDALAHCPHHQAAIEVRDMAALTDGPCMFHPTNVRVLPQVTTQRRFWEAGSEIDVPLTVGERPPVDALAEA